MAQAFVDIVGTVGGFRTLTYMFLKEQVLNDTLQHSLHNPIMIIPFIGGGLCIQQGQTACAGDFYRRSVRWPGH